jgi:outer membrane cobalamin receptor
MDGQPFNELLYQTVAIGNRFPVDAIERIEIIRGPGSAIYGGSAEYGVINIITKAAESLNGVNVYGVGGFHASAVGRTNAGLMLAKRSEKFAVDASIFKGKGIVSDQTFDGYDLADVSQSDPMNLNFGLRVGGLSFRTMYDQFETSDPYQFIKFDNFYSDLRYTWKATPKLSIVPQLKYYNQIPWHWGSVETGLPDFKSRATRKHLQLDGIYDISRKVNVNLGVLYYVDQATDLLDLAMYAGTNKFKLNNFAMFAQGLIKHRLFNATLGFRYEKSNRYDAAFVPRLALTKKIENFHFKILYSQAFRAPSIQNINLALTGDIKPEKSNVFEAEFGYQFTPEMLLAVNAYRITTKNVMTYGSEGEGDEFFEWYENATKMGTRGVEVIYNIKKKGWYANLSYSFSQAIGGDSTVQTYIIPQTEKQYTGMLAHKVTLNSSFTLAKSVTFNPSFIYGGKRYAFTELDENEELVAAEVAPYLLANAFINFRNLLPGLTTGLGVYDILNAQPSIPQAYNGGYLPVPGRGREYIVKLSYQINFK